jgi:NAD(P)-dependent dehydrogenase (short-subunit alcohol dehydrogenase family)
METAMQGKVIVITGATSGIGRIAAARLAQMGARLVLVARDAHRAEQTLAELRKVGPEQAHGVHFADLSTIAEVKRVGSEIAAAEPRIDVLINNAGSIFGSRQMTADGLERTFAVNHMAYFVLTHVLLQRLKASAPARIVNTASAAHSGQPLAVDDLQMARGYGAKRAYGCSKLCNILFTRELARRLAGAGVTANCLHPGHLNTGLGQRDNGLFGQMVRLYLLFGGRAEQGAELIVQLASDPALAGVTGEYFRNGRPIRPRPAAEDDDAARRLWVESARIAGLSKDVPAISAAPPPPSRG